MHVKGQLKDAQIEVFTTAARPAAGKPGRKIYDSDLEIELVDTGTVWKGSFDNLQDQFDSQTSNEQGAWRSKMHSVGTLFPSMLDESQFQAEFDSKWVLCDGRSVSGSDYETITGNSFIPDARGLALRGKNNTRTDGKENPDGELGLGAYQADEYKSHNHNYNFYFSNNVNFGGADATAVGAANTFNVNRSVDASGGNETRMKNITVNYFIKINR